MIKRPFNKAFSATKITRSASVTEARQNSVSRHKASSRRTKFQKPPASDLSRYLHIYLKLISVGTLMYTLESDFFKKEMSCKVVIWKLIIVPALSLRCIKIELVCRSIHLRFPLQHIHGLRRHVGDTFSISLLNKLNEQVQYSFLLPQFRIVSRLPLAG